MSTGWALALAVLLLAGNAFFVGAEFALVSVRRDQVAPLAASGSRRARVTLRALEQVSLMMAGCQLGITACSLGLGAVGEPAVAHLLEPVAEAAGLPEGLVHPLAFAVALAVVVSLHMVLGEMVPKNIALAGPTRSALLLGPPLHLVVRLLRPLILGLNLLANAVLRLVRVDPQDEVTSSFSAEEVAAMLEESHREGLLDPDEHGLVSGALAFADVPVGEVAQPVAKVAVVGPRPTAADVEEVCAATGWSRFPVREADGSTTCYVHARDVLDVPADRRDDELDPGLFRPLVRLAADVPLREALSTMQEHGTHLAVLAETDGGDAPLVGLVAMHDVLEALVGEVVDSVAGEEPHDPRLVTSD